jgi:hypothetical protein
MRSYRLQAGALPNSQPPTPGAMPLPVMGTIVRVNRRNRIRPVLLARSSPRAETILSSASYVACVHIIWTPSRKGRTVNRAHTQ